MILEFVITGVLFLLFGFPSLLLSLQYLFGHIHIRRAAETTPEPRDPCVVLIPAHNEEAVISQTIESVQAELSPTDRLLVVADNCTDMTAERCRLANVEVIERHSNTERGKGYALDYGVRHIAQAPPATLVIIDADTMVTPGAIDRLVSSSQQRNSVTQALNSERSPKGAPDSVRIAEFTWKVKNHIRSAGMQSLGLGCQLSGSGMAFPWHIFTTVSLASASIVEDRELTLKLAEKKQYVFFESTAEFYSYFPTSTVALDSQRTRWEHGHLASIISLIPKTLTALINGNFKTALQMIDAMLPPTILWLTIMTLSVLVSSVFAIGGLYLSFIAIAIPYLILLLSLLLLWRQHGPQDLKISSIVGLVRFLVNKLTIYKSYVNQKQQSWIKTPRDSRSE